MVNKESKVAFNCGSSGKLNSDLSNAYQGKI